ncbi:MAG: dihydroorotase [Spirochaetes bacterium]|nr:dihydroorotase [Spirochaetota bacterium]
MKLMIKNGRVVDPFEKLDEKLDVLVENNLIKKIGKNINTKADQEYNASGKIVCPGLVDMHTHLREPGFESKEKISTGTKSAALGGFTSVICMANTDPVIDNQATVKLVHYIAENEGVVKVFPVAAITKQSLGEELTEFGDLYRVGVVGFSDDGHPVMNAEIMRRALEYALMFDVPIMDHCEDLDLSSQGMVNEGYYSTVRGLKGIPTISESIIVGRDLLLAKYTGGKIHLQHVTTKESVNQIRVAKKEGVNVTAEVTPHHISLTDKEIINYDTNYKINPPLRSEEDRKALLKGLKDNTIDVIATDHAPHTVFEKDQEFNHAPFGIIGLETAIPLIFMNLVEKKALGISQALEKVTKNPCRIMKIRKNGLREGEVADITVIDPELQLVYTKKMIVSKGMNSPFIGKKLKGFPTLTVVNGKIVMKDRRLL